MSLKHLVIGVLMTIATLASAAGAQEEGARNNELSGLIGRTYIDTRDISGGILSGDHIRFGRGLSFEVNYAHQIIMKPLFSVAVELPVVADPEEDIHVPANVAPSQYGSYFITPSARVNLFPDLRVSPWGSFGGGLGHFSESSTLVFGGKNTGQTGDFTGVIQIGLGLDFKVTRRFAVRGAVRDFWSGTPHFNVTTSGRQNNFFVSGGIVYYF